MIYRDEITFINEHQHPEIMVEVVSHGVNISKINVKKKTLSSKKVISCLV